MKKKDQVLPVGLPGPSSWFLKELECIDPRYYPFYNRFQGYWEIVCNVHDKIGDREVVVAVYPYLNDGALNDMRRRKTIGLMLKGDPKRYRDWLKKEQQEARRKQLDLAVDMKTEGWMKIYNWDRRKIFT